MKATAASRFWKRFAAAWKTRASPSIAVRRVSREVVFTTHTPVPAGHDRFNAGLDGRAPRAAARRTRPLAGKADGAGPRESRQSERRVLHDRAGAEAFAARQCSLGAAWRSFARTCGRVCIRASPRTKFPSATSPTACTCRPGWRRRCSACTTAIWARAGTSTAARRSNLGGHRRCGRRRAVGNTPAA